MKEAVDGYARLVPLLAGVRAALGRARAVVGFDGTVDVICRPVESRRGAGGDYTPFPSMAALGGRIVGAIPEGLPQVARRRAGFAERFEQRRIRQVEHQVALQASLGAVRSPAFERLEQGRWQGALTCALEDRVDVVHLQALVDGGLECGGRDADVVSLVIKRLPVGEASDLVAQRVHGLKWNVNPAFRGDFR